MSKVNSNIYDFLGNHLPDILEILNNTIDYV